MKKVLLTLSVFFVLFFAMGCQKKEASTKIVSSEKVAANKDDTSLADLVGRGEFVIGLDDSFPPMGYRDDDNNIVGFDIDLAKEVASRLGVKFRAQPISWDAKELELTTGKIDCIWNGFTITDERESAMCMSHPYLNNAQVLVVNKDSSINSLEDAKNLTIGLQKGSSAQDAIDSRPDFSSTLKDIVFYQENITALNDLELHGIDAVVMDSVVAEFDISSSGKPLRVVSDVLSHEGYGIGFRKGDIALCKKVEATLSEMKIDGTVNKISTKWFGHDITVIK